MMASRRLDPRKARPLAIFCLVMAIAFVPGCGEDPTRLAGTLDMPEKKPSKPDVKAIAKEAKEARIKGKAASSGLSNSPDRAPLPATSP